MAYIDFDALRLNRASLEIRHPQAYLYWDNCGKCILDINAKTKGMFDFKELRGGQECVLKTDANQHIEFAFGYLRSILAAQFLPNISFFKEYADPLFGAVRDNLKIQKISRIGFRLWFIYKTNSEKESQEIIESLGLYSLAVERFEGFGREVVTSNPSILIRDGNERITINVSAAHRDGELPVEAKHVEEFVPSQCILIDLDFFIEGPPVDIAIEPFVSGTYAKTKKHISNIINNRKS